MPPSKEVGARVRAARIQAGYQRRRDLTDQLPLPRFGEKLLGQVERGERVLYEHEADALAHVLSVDPGQFYDPAARSDLGEVLALLHEAREEREAIEELLDRQNRNLATQSGILERIEAALVKQTVAADRADAQLRAEVDRLISHVDPQAPANGSPHADAEDDPRPGSLGSA